MVAENIVVLKNVFDSGFTILGAVDRNADLQRVISGRRFVAQDQDGFVAERQDGIGNRTKQEALQGRAAMRTHDDQIGAGFFSNFCDCRSGFADSIAGGSFDACGFQCFDCRFKNDVGFLVVITAQGAIAD